MDEMREQFMERVTKILQEAINEVSEQDALVAFGQRYFEERAPGARVEIERPVLVDEDGVAHINAHIWPQYPLTMIQVSFSVPRGPDEFELEEIDQ